MKVWVLLLIALVLYMVYRTQEGLVGTNLIVGPKGSGMVVWGNSVSYEQPETRMRVYNMASETLRTGALMVASGSAQPDFDKSPLSSDEKAKLIILSLVSGFWPTYEKATNPITAEDIDAYISEQDSSLPEIDEKETPAPEKAKINFLKSNYTNGNVKALLTKYYMDQLAMSAPAEAAAASGGTLLETFGMRETFKTPQPGGLLPYDDVEMTRIYNLLSETDKQTLASLVTQMGSTDPVVSVKAMIAFPVAGFFMSQYSPNAPITNAMVDTFTNNPQNFMGQPPNIAPIMNRLLKAYFVGQTLEGAAPATSSSGPRGPNMTCPTGQRPFNFNVSGTGPEDWSCATMSTTNPNTGPTGTTGPTGGTGSAPPAPSIPNVGSPVTPQAPIVPPDMGRNIWGPNSSGMGTPIPGLDGSGAGSEAPTSYPAMFGGVLGKFKGAADKSALPNSKGLGSDANSGFLPYSRAPGDMDLVPDPYRVSSTFSTSSYSSKTEPAPFLADFSAFLK